MIFTEQIFRNSPPGDKVVVWVLFKKHVTKNLEHSVSFKVSEQNQNPPECLKSSVWCLCFNTAQALPISHYIMNFLSLFSFQ